MDLAKQYDNFSDDFSTNQDIGENSNRMNRELFWAGLEFVKPGMKLLDLACGDGLDLAHYQELGADIYGLDASEELLKIAATRVPKENLKVGLFEDLPFDNEFFDVVLSKYALQTSKDIQPAFAEIHRVLKSGGIMMYLVTHPFRQYFERREISGDYFEQIIVDSHILNDTVTVQEPTHTIAEYLNSFLFEKFDVQMYDERWDPAAECIDGRKYPGFFILKAKKR